MATATGTVQQWNQGRKTAWSTDGWRDLDTAPYNSGQYQALGGTYNHRVCFKVKMPTFSGTATKLTFTWNGKKSSSTSGTTYAVIHSSFKEFNDTSVAYTTGALGTGSMSYNSTAWAKRSIDISITGSITSGGTYYIYLYTNSTGVVYRCAEGSSYYSLTLTYTPSYTVSYNANGGSGSMSSSTTSSSITLPSCSFSAPASTTSTRTVTFNANGGSCSTSSLASTSTTSYSFSKWAAGSTSGTQYAAGASFTPTANTTMYAIWTSSASAYSAITLPTATRGNSSSSCTVTYNANGGSVSPTSATSSRTTTYTFKGWSTSSSATSGSTGSYTPTGDVTLYATWSSSTGAYGAVTLPTPTRDGYDFKGWSTSSSATSGSTGSYTPTGNVTLYATWQIKTYSVSYNANGYGSAPASQTKTHGTNLTLQSFIANQSTTGYKVSYDKNGGTSTPTAQTSTITKKQTYWNTNSSGTGTNYSSGGTYSTNAAATMYAIWGSSTNNAITLASAISRNSSTSTYTISYNVNGGNSTAPSAQTLTRTTPYTFNKWAAGSTSGTQYAAGASYTPSAAITMYATWTTGTTTGSITLASAATKNNTTANGYTVSFNANGGSCSTSSLTATDTIKWTFAGWNTNSGGTGTNYSAGGSYSTSANATLYAKWTSSVATRGSITLPTATRDGYNFKGWSTSSSATSGSTGSYTPSSSHTLYAVWELKTYAISYNANGHGTAPSGQTKSHGVTLGLRSFIGQQTGTGYKVSFNANNGTSTPSALTSTLYYDQTYWNTNSSGTGTNYGSGANYTANAAATLYAIWKTTNGAITLPSAITRNSVQENGYTVTFNANGGSCSTTSLQAKNTRNYTFNKWAAGSTSGTGYSAGASYTPSAAVTMYATWTESVTKGSISLPTPTRTGYTFMGWSTSSTATSGSTGNYTPSGNVTLYATWKANGAVQIGTGSGHQMALVYIHNGTEYVMAIPYVHDGTEWKMAIG